MKVSVIIPTFNAPDQLLQALDSVLTQTYKDLEIVIVDDGSQQQTWLALHPYLEKHRNIQYLYQNNKGPAAARNTGIRASEGEYVAFLDHDDIWLANKVEYQVDVLDRSPNVGLVYCRFSHFFVRTGVLETDRHEYCDGWVFERFLTQNYIPTASLVMIRRECLEKVGGFTESLRIVDDYDLYIRLAEHSQFAYIDDCLVIWRRHVQSMSCAKQEMVENRIKMRRSLLSSGGLNFWQKFLTWSALKRDWFELGRILQAGEDLSAARIAFWRSLPRNSFRSIGFVLSCGLPLPVFRWLKKVKRTLHAPTIKNEHV